MENTIYIGLSRQLTLQTQMTLVSNNIANMNTNGYRAQEALFEEYVADPRGEKFPFSQVYSRGQFDITRPGPLQETGNPLDVALVGPGFIAVQTPAGERYTRNGGFTVDAQGQLMTQNGHLVASEGGAITIPPETRQVKITETGSVIADDNVVGQIRVVEFANPQEMFPEGSGLYNSNGVAQPSPATRMVQGSLEGSNVQPIVEMTNMIRVHREYESLQRMLSNQHDLKRSAIQKLTERA